MMFTLSFRARKRSFAQCTLMVPRRFAIDGCPPWYNGDRTCMFFLYLFTIQPGSDVTGVGERRLALIVICIIFKTPQMTAQTCTVAVYWLRTSQISLLEDRRTIRTAFLGVLQVHSFNWLTPAEVEGYTKSAIDRLWSHSQTCHYTFIHTRLRATGKGCNSGHLQMISHILWIMYTTYFNGARQCVCFIGDKIPGEWSTQLCHMTNNKHWFTLNPLLFQQSKSGSRHGVLCVFGSKQIGIFVINEYSFHIEIAHE